MKKIHIAVGVLIVILIILYCYEVQKPKCTVVIYHDNRQTHHAQISIEDSSDRSMQIADVNGNGNSFGDQNKLTNSGAS